MITCDDTGFGAAWLPVPSYSANTPSPLKEFCKPTRDLVKGIIGILCEKSTDEICLSACRCGRCRSPPNATDAAIACDRRCLCLQQALPATGNDDHQSSNYLQRLRQALVKTPTENAFRHRLSMLWSPLSTVSKTSVFLLCSCASVAFYLPFFLSVVACHYGLFAICFYLSFIDH